MSCDVSWQELAAFAAADADPNRRDEIREHLAGCDDCRRRLEALRAADAALESVRPMLPPASAVLAARRAVSQVTRAKTPPEIMTLDDVGDLLRLSAQELDEIAAQLPAFELAGQIRVRRARLMEWIERRERTYARQSAAGWAARVASDMIDKGVA